MSCKVASLHPYEKLIGSIDIGWIGNVKEDSCYDLNKVEGRYRSFNTISAIHAIILFKRCTRESLMV